MYAFDIVWYIYYDYVSLSLISETKDAVSPNIIPKCWNHDVKQKGTDKLKQLGIRIRKSCEKVNSNDANSITHDRIQTVIDILYRFSDKNK